MRELVTIILASVTLTACSKIAFQSSKDQTLQKASVMGGTGAQGELHQNGNPATGSAATIGQLPATNSTGYGYNATTGDLSQPAYMGLPGQISEPISRRCSDTVSANYQNLKGALAHGYPVRLVVNGSPCTTNSATVQSLALQATLSIAQLKNICPTAVPAMGKVEPVLEIDGYAFQNSMTDKFRVLWALNKSTTPAEEVQDSNCTPSDTSSPLVIHLPSAATSVAPIALTSIEGGVSFDLLGAKNDHQSVRIGWFSNTDYAMLALPNARGEVNGIDQLFGNATLGPDGDFSANGYVALAKYDGKSADGHFFLAEADGRIDINDPIYARLRVWKDINLDGVASADELISLSDAGIAFIDVNYSSDYYEDDIYGNETQMKSVIGYDNGMLDLIFDLWFVYQNEGAQ